MAKKHISLSFLSWFNIISGLCSIAGFLFVLFGNKTNALIGLILVAVFLSIVCFTLIYGVIKSIKNSCPEDSVINFVFLNYEEIDNSHHIHDVYKIVQCKRPFLSSIYHKFKWSGKIYPKISSNLQTVGSITKNDGNDYDEVELILKHPLFYNQSTTLHFHTELDNSDSTARPFLGYKIIAPMAMVMFKVILKDKPDNYTKEAIVERRKIDTAFPAGYQFIRNVSFDKRTKSYTYPLLEPEVGYSYRLRWGDIQ